MSNHMYTVVDDNGKFVFTGTKKECNQWKIDNNKPDYRVWK